MSMRVERVSALIKEELCKIFREKIRDPRVGFLTITNVDLTADLRSARVYFSVIGDDKVKKDTLDVIRKASGFIRGQLGSRIRIKFTPELTFMLDNSLEHSQHIDDILKKIHSNSPSHNEIDKDQNEKQ